MDNDPTDQPDATEPQQGVAPNELDPLLQAAQEAEAAPMHAAMNAYLQDRVVRVRAEAITLQEEVALLRRELAARDEQAADLHDQLQAALDQVEQLRAEAGDATPSA